MSPVEAANENLKSEIILHASAYDIPLDDKYENYISISVLSQWNLGIG